MKLRAALRHLGALVNRVTSHLPFRVISACHWDEIRATSARDNSVITELHDQRTQAWADLLIRDEELIAERKLTRELAAERDRTEEENQLLIQAAQAWARLITDTDLDDTTAIRRAIPHLFGIAHLIDLPNAGLKPPADEKTGEEISEPVKRDITIAPW